MSSPSKRREMDLMKLMMSDYKVEMINDGMQEFYVEFNGPKESPYQGGVWKIRVELPDAYPYKSPSIGFVNKIYHPNVDEMSGSVCLDVINQTWSPMFDLVNVFEVFLPQLLLYPNPSDPLNGEAAALMMRDRTAYEQRVKGHIGVWVLKINVFAAFIAACSLQRDSLEGFGWPSTGDCTFKQIGRFCEPLREDIAMVSASNMMAIVCGSTLFSLLLQILLKEVNIEIAMIYLTPEPFFVPFCIFLNNIFFALVKLLICLYEFDIPEYCEKYAKAEDIRGATEEKSSDEELSEDEYDSSDEAVAGQPDP
ncbi:hypothetical protein JRO89_XS13G0160200 [Xanthoceras sorbifolium]|uniref:UBC core domain-containing protein n=1 Tax=Xanthoceras sorbifolium TaxID=99658 RepID=A0ABQ8H8K4_9ROSI|nr:hypothetical protein JRO89_XS13G0160200 [Xanthoceras sorbifolium]